MEIHVYRVFISETTRTKSGEPFILGLLNAAQLRQNCLTISRLVSGRKKCDIIGIYYPYILCNKKFYKVEKKIKIGRQVIIVIGDLLIDV